MTVSFPLSRADFFDLLPIQNMGFPTPAPQRQITGLGGGDILSAEVGPARWQGSVSLAPMKSRRADRLSVLLSTLENPGATFEAYKGNQIGPDGDRLGTALAAASVTISAFNTSASTLTLSGLPVGLSLAVGDMVSFAYEGRRALHRFAQDGTGALRVVPHLRPGVVTGAAVELVRPYCVAVLVPGTVSHGSSSGGITSGMSFDFRQTLGVI